MCQLFHHVLIHRLRIDAITQNPVAQGLVRDLDRHGLGGGLLVRLVAVDHLCEEACCVLLDFDLGVYVGVMNTDFVEISNSVEGIKTCCNLMNFCQFEELGPPEKK